jgi:hypothetical protein
MFNNLFPKIVPFTIYCGTTDCLVSFPLQQCYANRPQCYVIRVVSVLLKAHTHKKTHTHIYMCIYIYIYTYIYIPCINAVF